MIRSNVFFVALFLISLLPGSLSYRILFDLSNTTLTDPTITCYVPPRLPMPQPAFFPTVADCRAATSLMEREKHTTVPMTITSDSHRVPRGSYLYPHSWTVGTCSVVVGFEDGQTEDVATLLGLSGRATQIFRLCVTDRYLWGGQVAAGEEKRLIVSVRGAGRNGPDLPVGILEINTTMGHNSNVE